MTNNEHVVGVRILPENGSASLSDKLYYYRTDKQYTAGQKIKIRVPTGGRPDTVIIVSESYTVKPDGLKKMEEVWK